MHTWYASLAAAAMMLAAVATTHARADIVCPKGSLHDFVPNAVWQQYVANSRDYIARMLRRMEDVRDRQMVMERMFEEGFIAATDIVNAHCVSRPIGEPWSTEIKQKRREAWCREWGDAYFCKR